VKADVAIADLHKGKLALRRLGGSSLADQAKRARHPAAQAQTTPVPAQAMHFKRPRRLMFGLSGNSF